jgi:hypothetical protein
MLVAAGDIKAPDDRATRFERRRAMSPVTAYAHKYTARIEARP